MCEFISFIHSLGHEQRSGFVLGHSMSRLYKCLNWPITLTLPFLLSVLLAGVLGHDKFES